MKKILAILIALLAALAVQTVAFADGERFANALLPLCRRWPLRTGK